MAMNVQTLADGLEAMEETQIQVESNLALSDAFHDFMLESDSNGIRLIPGSGQVAKTAFDGVMSALVSPEVPVIPLIVSACTAYWGALVIPGAYGPTCISVTPPPGLAGLQAALTAAFQGNVLGGLSKSDSAKVIAAAWAPTQLGALAQQVIPPSPTPVPLPVL